MTWNPPSASSVAPGVAAAYISRASRDGHVSRLHRTLRISQAHPEWLVFVQSLLAVLGKRSWIYRETARRVWTIETSYLAERTPSLAGSAEMAAFARGYFDAEGGVPRDDAVRFYVQFCQKDRDDLARLQALLHRLGVPTGRIHNPSARVDPDYWRLYVRTHGHARFAAAVGSWHPVKGPILSERFPCPATRAAPR